MIYCDYNSSAPLSENLRGVFFDLPFANPSAQHREGKKSLKAINETTKYLKEYFGVDDYEVFYHSGSTEGCNQCIQGSLEKGDTFFYFPLDHSAILSQVNYLSKMGIKCVELEISQDLDFLEKNIEIMKKSISKKGLLNFTWVHNETGRIWNLDIIERLKKDIPNLLVHVDATQSIGKIKDYKNVRSADFFTYSGHKFGALNGVGFSFYKKKPKALIYGGKHQKGLRAGTLNIQGIVSLRYALEDLESKISLDHCINIQKELDDLFQRLVSKNLILDFSHQPNKAWNTLFLVFKELKTQILLPAIDLVGVSLGSGSACSSGIFEENKLLNSLGLQAYSKNTLRVSVSPLSDLATLKETLLRIEGVIEKLA